MFLSFFVIIMTFFKGEIFEKSYTLNLEKDQIFVTYITEWRCNIDTTFDRHNFKFEFVVAGADFFSMELQHWKDSSSMLIQSAKILLLPSKCEIIFVILKGISDK